MNDSTYFMEKLPVRKPTRLKDYDYSTPGAYFITICTENRKNLFWNGDIDVANFRWSAVGANCVRPRNLPLSDLGKIVESELEIWHNTYENVRLHSYAIMPNHLHIMVVINGTLDGRTQFAPTVNRMVKQFKGAITKSIGKPIWQKSFFEHIIRNQYDYDVRSKYIEENPIRWQCDEYYIEE